MMSAAHMEDLQASTLLSGKCNWLQANQLRLEAPAHLQRDNFAASAARDAHRMPDYNDKEFASCMHQ